MLPKLKTFSTSEIDKFLFLGLDLYEVDENEMENFTAFNSQLNKDSMYFITCSESEIIEDILGSEPCVKFLEDFDIEVKSETSGYFSQISLSPFSRDILINFMHLVMNELA